MVGHDRPHAGGEAVDVLVGGGEAGHPADERHGRGPTPRRTTTPAAARSPAAGTVANTELTSGDRSTSTPGMPARPRRPAASPWRWRGGRCAATGRRRAAPRSGRRRTGSSTGAGRPACARTRPARRARVEEHDGLAVHRPVLGEPERHEVDAGVARPSSAGPTPVATTALAMRAPSRWTQQPVGVGGVAERRRSRRRCRRRPSRWPGVIETHGRAAGGARCPATGGTGAMASGRELAVVVRRRGITVDAGEPGRRAALVDHDVGAVGARCTACHGCEHAWRGRRRWRRCRPSTGSARPGRRTARGAAASARARSTGRRRRRGPAPWLAAARASSTSGDTPAALSLANEPSGGSRSGIEPG